MRTFVKNQDWVIFVLCASVSIDFIGYGIVIPLLPFYAQSFGASPIEIGLLLSVFLLMQLFAPPLWGNFSDRVGFRLALLLNIAGTSISFIWLGLANSLLMLFAARILAGICGSSLIIAQAYIGNTTTTSANRIKALGFLQAATGISFLMGPAIGSLLLGNDLNNPNFRLPGLTAGIISFLTLIIAYFCLAKLGQNNLINKSITEEKPQTLWRSIIEIWQRPLVPQLSSIFAIVMFAGIGAQTVLPLWCENQFNWGPKELSYLIIFCGLIGATVSIGLIKPLTKKLGESNLLFSGLISIGIGLLIISISSNVPLFLGGIALAICGQATTKPVITSLFSQLADTKQQGKTLGLANSLSGLASFLGTIAAGVIFEIGGANSPYLISGVLILLAAVFSRKQLR